MPLTTTGICIQILSSISTYRREQHRCSANDCKVVLNLLIRKFSEPLVRQGRQRTYISSIANTYAGKTFKDHVFPVGEIMSQLLALPDDALVPTDANVAKLDTLLAEMLILVTITDAENAALNAAGCQRRMPKAWNDPGHEHYQHPWARYKAAGIVEMISAYNRDVGEINMASVCAGDQTANSNLDVRPGIISSWECKGDGLK